jgi:hypothetical protein
MKAQDHPAFKPELSVSVKVAADLAKLKATIDKKKGR